MNENKVNVVVPKDYNGNPIEVILREGVAAKQLDPKEPIVTDIKGAIDSPYRWLEKRVELIDQQGSHILVDRDECSISLIIDERDYYQTSINGSLQPSTEIEKFGINTEKTWEPAKLGQFLKMNRAFFPSREENMTLVSILKNFKAKVNQDVEKSKEDNGNRTDNFSQVVDSNLPKSFKLSIPLFKSHQPEEIEVEIYADIDGREVRLSLVSAGANETIESTKNEIINEQLGLITGVAPDIAIIEI